MWLTYLKQVCECLEIADKGIYTEKQLGFLRDMKAWLPVGSLLLSTKQKRWIESLYAKACKSPY